MDPNYAKAKFALESKNILQSKHRGCWYYTKYFFFFLSIIQFLIILGLVLFMLYGNAHAGTENRLESVEGRYESLTIDYTSLNNNFTQVKSKLATKEKEYGNCSNLLAIALKPNRTIIKPVIATLPYHEICRACQNALDRCNTTYIIETLQLKHEKLILQRDYDRLKETCNQSIGTLSSKSTEVSSENVKLRKTIEDQQTQAKVLQAVCTDINQRFETELDRMKSRLNGIITSHEPFQYSKCWSLSVEVKNNIDQAINNLKQDVNNVMFENSQLKTDNRRVADNFQICSQEKMAVISEKNNLSKEKGELNKQLFEKKEELAKSYSNYMRKEEELQNCRRMQTIGRVPGAPFIRNQK